MDGKKAVDASLTLASIGLDLVTQNYVGAALQSIGAIKDFARDAQEAKLGRWWKGVVTSKTWETPQEVQGLIDAKLREDPKAKETVWAAAKAILETISDEAAEIIGSLTAEYLRDGKGPDPFFRGAVRVLADLSSDELHILRAIVHLGCNSSSMERVQINVEQNGLRASAPFREGKPNMIQQLASKESILRLVRLLKSNDLAWETGNAGPFKGTGSPDTFEVSFPLMARLASHLGVQH